MTNQIKTIKNCAGNYTVTDGVLKVEVYSDNFGYGTEWVANAEWDHHRYSDPLPRKRDAVETAKYMINQVTDQERENVKQHEAYIENLIS